MSLSTRHNGVWRGCAIPFSIALFLFLTTLLPVLWGPPPALAHAFLERSDPVANSVVPSAPSLVRLWFTERIEAEFTTAALYDALGQRVATADSQQGEPNELILPLPADLPPGTYTVQWRNVSADDGHPESGYVPFTIGTQLDVVTPIVPELTQFSPPPVWVSAMSRWAGLLGISVALGAIVTWLVVLRPAIRHLESDDIETIGGTVYSLALIGIGVALAGSLLALSVQSANSGSGYGPGGMLDVATQSDWGTYWLARIVLLVVFAGTLSLASLWSERPKGIDVAFSLGTGLAALVPFALISHAASQEVGQPMAVATDWVHLAATALWIGGLVALLEALIFGTRAVPRDARRPALAGAIQRFSTLAIVAVLLLAGSGLYTAWLQVGNLEALRSTDYGRLLTLKVALFVLMLGLGLINQRILAPRLGHAARGGKGFSRALAAEVTLGLGVILIVGLMTSLPPARDELIAEAGATDFHWSEQGIHASLYISPGAAGFNRYTIDTAPSTGTFPDDVQVILRFSTADAVEGLREVIVPKLSGTRYEASGSELSTVGAWDLELLIRRPGEADWRKTVQLQMEQTPPATRLPGEPPRFEGVDAMLAIGFLALAVGAIVVGLRLRDQWRERLTVVGFGIGLALAGSAVLAVNLVPPSSTGLASSGPPVLASAESVAAGRVLFQANCVSCHGEDATGNGPAAPSLRVEPADLTAPHVDQHSDQDVHWWIRKGIGGNMPGFEGELTNEQIWNLVNFIRNLRRQEF